MEKLGITGDNRLRPVGHRWTTSRTACGSFLCPQAVESLCPRIHRRLTWSDGLSTVLPVEKIWTTSQSPGCGRKKVTTSVESGRNPAPIRTAGVGSVAVKTGREPSERGAEALKRRVRSPRRTSSNLSERAAGPFRARARTRRPVRPSRLRAPSWVGPCARSRVFRRVPTPRGAGVRKRRRAPRDDVPGRPQARTAASGSDRRPLSTTADGRPPADGLCPSRPTATSERASGPASWSAAVSRS